jgi:hypothetical protein
MGLKNEFIKMIEKLSSQFAIPPVATVFFPPFLREDNHRTPNLWPLALRVAPWESAIFFYPMRK